MVTFNCSGCSHDYEVPDKYKGKKVRCKKCNTMMRIPNSSNEGSVLTLMDFNEASSESSESICVNTDNIDTAQSSCQAVDNTHDSGLPKSALYAIISVGVILLGLFLYAFGFRDTWETDNSVKLHQMIQKSKQHYDYEEYQDGLAQYETLCAFIGERELKREELRSEYDNVRSMYESYKQKLRAEQAEIKRKRQEVLDLEKVKELEQLGNDYASTFNIRKAVRSYDDALAIIARNTSDKLEFSLAKQRINSVKPDLDRRLSDIEKEEQHEKSMKEKGYVKFRGKWLSPEQYEIAKNSFPATEIREELEKRISNNSLNLTLVTISLTKGINLEYPYDVTINAPTSFQYINDTIPRYTFYINDALELSERYTTNGYGRTEVAEYLIRELHGTLRSLR